MAIDSREKRFSMMTLNRMWEPAIITSSGTIDQAERQSFLHGYYGILWEAASIADGTVDISYVVGKSNAGVSYTKSDISVSLAKSNMTVTMEVS